MRVERLDGSHELSAFTCGVTELDEWLRDHALDNQVRNLSRTFVLVGDDGGIAGYYSLTMGGVRREDLPPRYGRGLPRYEIGMVLLARLAVHQDHQRQGIGRDLLVEAIERAALAGEHAAARFIAVDPIDQNAGAFYSAFGFKAVPGDEGGRMYVRLDDALTALGEREN